MAGNTIRTTPTTENKANEEVQVTGTDFNVEGENKRAIDVNILGSQVAPQEPMMKCESGIIDLEKNVTIDINTTKFDFEICSVEFYNSTMRKIVVAYRVLGANTFRVCPTVDKEAVTWKAQGV